MCLFSKENRDALSVTFLSHFSFHSIGRSREKTKMHFLFDHLTKTRLFILTPLTFINSLRKAKAVVEAPTTITRASTIRRGACRRRLHARNKPKSGVEAARRPGTLPPSSSSLLDEAVFIAEGRLLDTWPWKMFTAGVLDVAATEVS